MVLTPERNERSIRPNFFSYTKFEAVEATDMKNITLKLNKI